MTSFDLSELAMAMNSADADAYIDPESGRLHFGFEDEYLGDEGDPIELLPDHWVRVEQTTSREAYLDMVEFAQAVPDARLRVRLLDALDGPGAFRRFRDAVHQDDDLARVWGRYLDACRQRRAAEWLAEVGLISADGLRGPAAESDAQRAECVAALGGRSDTMLGVVRKQEHELQSPQCRADPARLGELLAADFAEIGTSGRVWARDEVIGALVDERADAEPIHLTDLVARLITEDVALVQWTSERGEERALRTSLWRHDTHGWRLVHHQGTIDRGSARSTAAHDRPPNMIRSTPADPPPF